MEIEQRLGLFIIIYLQTLLVLKINCSYKTNKVKMKANEVLETLKQRFPNNLNIFRL